MFQPELELFEFIDGGMCKMLVDSGAVVTIYGDLNDFALHGSEVLNGLYRWNHRRKVKAMKRLQEVTAKVNEIRTNSLQFG